MSRQVKVRPAPPLDAYRACVGDTLRGRQFRSGDAAADEAAVHQALADAARACALNAHIVYGLVGPEDAAEPYTTVDVEIAEASEMIDLEGECTPEDTTTCDQKVSLGVAEGVACDLGLPSCGNLRDIVGGRYTSSQEADALLRRWVGEVRASPQATQADRDWADAVAEVALGS